MLKISYTVVVTVFFLMLSSCNRDEKKKSEEPTLEKHVSSAADLANVSPTSCAAHNDSGALFQCNETRGLSEERKTKQKQSCDSPPRVTWAQGACPKEALAASCVIPVALDGVSTNFYYYTAMFSGANDAEFKSAVEKNCKSVAGIWTKFP
jgi:hypothetical protein